MRFKTLANVQSNRTKLTFPIMPLTRALMEADPGSHEVAKPEVVSGVHSEHDKSDYPESLRTAFLGLLVLLR